MAQIFHRGTNPLAKASIYGGVIIIALAGYVFNLIYKSPYVNEARVIREQPVPFSHKHHVKDLGMDCRYCHTSVENSAFAGIPDVKTCMTCHSQIWTNAAVLEPVRKSYQTGRPLAWIRVNELPDYVYFNHSIHVNKGIACVTCHGPIEDMPLTWRQSTLEMKSCLECHRHPAPFVQARDTVFQTDGLPVLNQDEEKIHRWLAEKYKVKRAHGLHDMSSLNDPIHPKPPQVIPIRPEPARLPLDISRIREKLASSHGRDYWRSLEELSNTEEFRDFVQHEFPRDVDVWMEPVTRRNFLQLMGAGLAMAFFNGCRKPLKTIIPYNQAPEEIIPGVPLFYASALSLGGYGRGVLVENHTGRPTKIEGNPRHPDSLGATDVFLQAATLTFYDPDRSQVLTQGGMIQTWDAFLTMLRGALSTRLATQGAGLRVLTETITSPSLGDQLENLLKRFPQARWHQFEPVNRDAVRAGARAVFGQDIETYYRFENADVIVSLDADFLTGMPGSLHYARAFADGRRVSSERTVMNRLYAIETCPTVTGSMADHRLPLRPVEIPHFAGALARELGISFASSSAEKESWRPWVRAVARDLLAHGGKCLVIAGDAQPAAVHALAHAINQKLGNAGRTVIYSEPVEIRPVDQLASLRELTSDMKAGQVDTLIILGGNPVYDAPADFGFSDALAKVGTRVHLSLYEDETSALCDWHVPEAHPLESWGDVRAYDGTVSIVQPQIEPLYGGKTGQEFLSAMLDPTPRHGHDIVYGYWKRKTSLMDFDRFWRRTLHDGVMEGTAGREKSMTPRPHFLQDLPPIGDGNAAALEIVFRPDSSVWDGRYANNGWLQELPKSVTKLTWDNAAVLSPTLAERLGVSNEDVVELRWQGRSVQAPVWILPGHADQSVTVHLGYGRTRAGRVGNGAGFNAYALRTSDGFWSGAGVAVHRTGAKYRLANTQHHSAMEGRDFVRVGTLTEYLRNPRFAKDKNPPEANNTLYNYSQPKQSEQYSWGMAIDLNSCNGCNACVVACQAENNIPVVGKDEVAKGREMHWIRVDRYFTGDLDNPESYHQPVTCMHCEDAPCEPVCPVGATVHSEEGLNEMVYNRCVGTRYCSNNCPYKVRRFNFLAYTDNAQGPLKLLQNPDVTVRSRGVMEKCSYCVQRIQGAKITADKENRPVRDGEIVSACAQACPARAIVFGNLLDPESRVNKLKSEQRDYDLLSELGTRPHTSYQARLKNPNPELG